MLLIFLLIALNNCVKFPLTKRCACNEFEEIICKGSLYCSWDGSSCIDLTCKYQQEGQCDPFFSKYQCKWNDIGQSCEDHTYECSELTKEICFGFIFGMDCMWQDDQCKPQDCTQNDYCNPLKCSRNDTGCGQQLDNLDCSSYTTETCKVTDGHANICTLNDSQECKEYSVFSSSCSDYEDRIVLCNTLCYYDVQSLSCIPKECSQITVEQECYYFIIDIPSLQLIPCKWGNGTCNEATEEDFSTFKQLDCITHGIFHYTWQESTSTCKQCSSFIGNPDYEFYEQLMNGIEILKWALVWIALQI